MEEYFLTPAVILPSIKGFEVFGGEDLIATCPTKEEADFWAEIWLHHQIEFRTSMKQTFYRRKDSNFRMCPMYIEDGGVGTTGSMQVFWKCREIAPEGNIKYPTYTEQEILEYYTAITFPKAGK